MYFEAKKRCQLTLWRSGSEFCLGGVKSAVFTAFLVHSRKGSAHARLPKPNSSVDWLRHSNTTAAIVAIGHKGIDQRALSVRVLCLSEVVL